VVGLHDDLLRRAVSGRGEPVSGAVLPPIEAIYPDIRTEATEIPEPASGYLQQALDTLHAPDAAAVMAGSAVDAMLKHLGLTDAAAPGGAAW
jgi:hypothetical protein